MTNGAGWQVDALEKSAATQGDSADSLQQVRDLERDKTDAQRRARRMAAERAEQARRADAAEARATVMEAQVDALRGEVEAAQSAFRLAVKSLDQAAAKNLIHKNAAARTKSRLSKLFKQSATAN